MTEKTFIPTAAIVRPAETHRATENQMTVHGIKHARISARYNSRYEDNLRKDMQQYAEASPEEKKSILTEKTQYAKDIFGGESVKHLVAQLEAINGEPVKAEAIRAEPANNHEDGVRSVSEEPKRGRLSSAYHRYAGFARRWWSSANRGA